MVTELHDCTRCQSPLEKGDLRCAICGEAAPRIELDGSEVEIQVLRCGGCGATVDYDAGAGAPRCAFCGSVTALETAVDPMEQTERWLPFTVDPEEARGALKRWLGSRGFFRPADLADRSKLADLKPLWWVAWVFDARALISWTADSEVGSGLSAWAPHAGQVEMVFDDILVSASQGLSDEETTALAGSYDLSTAAGAAGGLPEGTQPALERFEVQRSLARRRILSAIDRVAATRVAAQHVPGHRHRKVQVASLLRGLETRRYALPAYVLAYRYKERLYRAVVHGQDADLVVGESPLSWAKVLLVSAIVAAVIVVGLVIAGVVAMG